jgi:hypothetical protein
LFPYRELFQALIRNQVRVVSWHSYGGFFVLACYPPRASFISSCLFRHAASNRSHIASHPWQTTWPLLHSALVQVQLFVGHKKPDSPRGRSGLPQSIKPVHIWPCPDSSDLAPFPSLTTVAVVNTPLSQRNVHYRTPAPIAATSRRAGFRWVASPPAWAG